MYVHVDLVQPQDDHLKKNKTKKTNTNQGSKVHAHDVHVQCIMAKPITEHSLYQHVFMTDTVGKRK